jgi:D-alanine-D-alanine ligase
MTVKKIHVAILCGGQSSEHEVSVNSAANILRALNPEKFTVSVIAIDQQGIWHALEPQAFAKHQGLGQVSDQVKLASHLSLCFGNPSYFHATLPEFRLDLIDVVFSLLHGPLGEDGAMQGLLKIAHIPFVGSDVLASAISMDKDVMKRLSLAAGLPVVDFLVFHRHQLTEIQFTEVVAQLKLPLFVKPCNLGSSVGVSKVHDEAEFLPALQAAFQLENKIIIEQGIKCREIECAVLGNAKPQASVLGEIIPHHEFYSYEAKYVDANGASLVIPADLPLDVTNAIRACAIKAFQTFECEGLARVDFFR